MAIIKQDYGEIGGGLDLSNMQSENLPVNTPKNITCTNLVYFLQYNGSSNMACGYISNGVLTKMGDNPTYYPVSYSGGVFTITNKDRSGFTLYWCLD